MTSSLKSSEFVLAGMFIVAVLLASIFKVDMVDYKELWDKAFYIVSGYGIFRQGSKLLGNGNLTNIVNGGSK